MNWKTFFICGLTGWCMEILFTSLGGLLRGDLLLNGHTSIWMFPIYGLAAVIGPLSVRLRHWPVLLRGCFYGAGIMLVEFISGSILRLPLSLGLQQNSLQYFWSCPPRLFSCMVHRRADL